jgi:hypothetical protein
VDDRVSSDQHTRSIGMQELSRYINGFQVKKMDNEWFIIRDFLSVFVGFFRAYGSKQIESSRAKKMRGDICKKICMCKHVNVDESEEVLSGACKLRERV